MRSAFLTSILALMGCSETGFSEVPEGAAEILDAPAEDDVGPDFGNWDLGTVPDWYVVMTVFGGSYAKPSELLVVDLEGQILDRWSPPAPASGLPDRFLRDVRLVEPGVVLVTADSAFGWDTRFDAPPAERPVPERGPTTEVWRGDLVRGSWERLVRSERATAIIEPTRRSLPEGWAETQVSRFLPLGPDALLAVTSPLDCGSAQAQTWAELSLDPAGEDVLLEPALPASGGTDLAVWRAQGGWTEDGSHATLLAYVDQPCTEPVLHLDVWDGKQAPQAISALPYDALLTGMRWDATSSTAILTAISTDDASAPIAAEVRWVSADGVRTEVLPDAGYAQPVALLDADQGAFAYLTWKDAERRDEIVIRARGREVWRIESLRDGLAERGMQIFDAVVMAAP